MSISRYTIPLVSRFSLDISSQRRSELDLITQALFKENNCGEEKKIYSDHVLESMPKPGTRILSIDDYSSFKHLEAIPGLSYYTSRAFVRAGDEDIVVGTFDNIAGYTEYLKDDLGLGKPEYLKVDKTPGVFNFNTVTHLLNDKKGLTRLKEKIRGREFVLHPFSGGGDFWSLAQELSGDPPVKVMSSLPTASMLANNKAKFLPIARKIIGDKNVINTVDVSDSKEGAVAMKEMASKYSKVGLNLPDSASGMGIELFESSAIADMDVVEIEKKFNKWAKEKNWSPNQGRPGMVAGWKSSVLVSPSVQVWIPPTADGLPIVEGVFEQFFLEKSSVVFSGGVVSTLPESINEKLAGLALEISYVLQHLGYVGRCSFDTIICGSSLEEDSQIKFVECNGRWGGTSTPMFLMNRLFGDYRKQPYQSLTLADPDLKGVKFKDFLNSIRDILYTKDNPSGWIILYNVGCIEPVGRIDVITLGETLQKAKERQQEFKKILSQRIQSLKT